MNRLAISDMLMYAEPALCLVTLLVLTARRQLRPYWGVAAFLATRVMMEAVSLILMRLADRRVPARITYPIYFYTYWSTYVIEAVLGFAIIYSIYNLAMAPLPGLQRLGRLMFRWAAGIAVAIALTIAMSPNLTGMKFAIRVVTQLQQTQSVLTLCMLLFVCLAIRPMGLSFRSKIFGVCMGLGLLATADLVRSAWLSHDKQMVSVENILGSVAICATLVIWTAYFAIPEPKRRMIVLPTTSPFLRWNQISMALGDEPGYVALGEVHPDMFAPAEVEIMRRASSKMEAAVV